MSTQGPARWLIVVAAITFLAFLLSETGSWILVAVVIAAIAAFVGFQQHQSKQAGSLRCLKCGEPMKATERWCKACGSASWTKN